MQLRNINRLRFFIFVLIFFCLLSGLMHLSDFFHGIRKAEAAQATYDFSTCSQGTDCYAYGTWSDWPGNVFDSRLASGDCDVAISSGSYTALSASDATGGDSDTNRYQAPDEGNNDESCTVFVFELTQNEADITQIDILWEGYGDAANTMNLYIWDYSQGCYSDGQGNCMSQFSYDNSADSGSGNADFTLAETISSNIGNFIDETSNNEFTYMVIDTSASENSFHDYAKVDITYTTTDVTVSSSGTQTSLLDIPSTDNYVGGAFIITDITGSRNVTGITITENGTVDAQNDLANVKLFYDLDSTSPYDCASESYSGSEPQFGLTTSFNGANGTASFTGSTSISTTQTMCVYTVLDVGSGAIDGETIEIEINIPSTDVTISSGSITTNTTFVRSGGTTGTSFSMDIGSAGTNRLVVVTAGDESDGNSLTSVTVDGKNCTKVTEADNPSGPGNHLEMWYCDEDDLGSSSGSVTIAIQGGNGGWATHASLFTGINQDGPNGSAVDDSTTGGTSVTTETTIAVSNGDVVATAAGQGSSGSMSTPGSPLTRVQDGPDPSSAVKGTAYAIESRTGNYTYTDNFSDNINRATMIAAVWSPDNSVKIAGTTTLRVPLNLGNFTECKKITIDNAKVSGSSNYSNFPVLVSLTEDYLKTTGNGGSVTDAEGDDIVFIDSDGSTQLDHEVEKYVAATGEYIPWVEAPTLKYNEDTVIYMYYGNSNIATSQENVAGVWDSNYEAVWHLDEEQSGTGNMNLYQDATSNDNDGDDYASATGQDGQVYDGQELDGGNDYIDSGMASTSMTNLTFSAWFKSDDAGFIGNDFVAQRFVTQRRSSSNSRFAIGINNNLVATYWHDGGNNVGEGTTNLLSGTWYYAALTYDGSTIRLYLNGSEENNFSESSITSSSSDTIQLGRQSNERYFDGHLDEVRISNTARSTDWITTEYNNQSSPATFYSVGACSGSTTIINWQESF